MERKQLHIALVGNPNSGKSSLFNSLTGLNQKVGNFPGVTVDKKTGFTKIGHFSANIIDLPGTYSLYPRRLDEEVAYKVILNQDRDIKADVIVVVADASNLKRNLLFCSQIIDLKRPVVMALTMMDLARKKGIHININEMERELGIPIVAVNPRKNKGIDNLKKAIEMVSGNLYKPPVHDFIDVEALAPEAIHTVKHLVPGISSYEGVHYLINHETFALADELQDQIEETEKSNRFNPTKTQAEEILQRYQRIGNVMSLSVSLPDPNRKNILTDRLDNIFLHRVWGYIILLLVLFLMFQCVFLIASYPMDWIDSGTAAFSGWLGNVLPENNFTDLLINGIIAGLGGIIIFVPQIMILFGLIALLEDTGYMARISFLTDRVMRSVGLNGKSVMPMISGFACAVPAIMSARSIENRKERLLTILITPLMSCSARLPVYVMLVGMVIPQKYFLGFISLQGLVMTGLYLLGVVFALLVSYIAKFFIRSKEKSYFILELPTYRSPRWKNALETMIEKAKIFVLQAGRIIMIISIILWCLSSFGPKQRMHAVQQQYEAAIARPGADTTAVEETRAAAKLENSYAGIMGKTIEPVIRPLGYDWKIGIALVTSFAAREVFVGTMATLYSVQDDQGENIALREKMERATFADGTKVFTTATGVSLLVFYVFAMLCMSTLAIVKRETGSWKWPLIQLAYMTGLAYILSFIVYQLLK
ncbi:ferrous iron transport protein B [Niabella ginsenosidivorans]|uniref:Ferrous iron transport protein B n=1 Tax=Niabella ginsenosidivorans TaxID=1176587 RepID=A0A1A9I6N6_9BACT|nr:ferrous iron transport protein B [Niabella ginsenosidivorans]ANH83357.1 ferrous iron transport protein B [Niabella ginsenosidivorans]